MQFLPSLHIAITCCFVFLLAYLLSRVFTYLAHSLIHGSHSSRKSAGSRRSRRIESFGPQIGTEEDEDEDVAAAALMGRLQEQDEDGDSDEDDADQDAQVRAAAVRSREYDMGGGIFDEGMDLRYDVQRDDGRGGSWRDEEGVKEEEVEVIEIRRNGGTTEREYEESEEGKREGRAEEKEASGRESVLGDAQGSSSQQQRLPPTWSDLQRMVHLSSEKPLPAPSVSPVPEY